MEASVYDLQETRNKIDQELTIRSSNAVILMCAIFIASIGLNLNSTAVIIGAMLVSPLMNPILGLGMALGISDIPLFKKALRLLLVQLTISIVTSTVYFYFSPLTAASDELIARTFPTIWDVLIAFAGGVAGWIGLRKKGANNIVPGVAIATALMPPVCTVGYAIANQNMTYALGASYLFLINCSFILIATFLGVKWLLRTDQSLRIQSSKRINRSLIALACLISIPSVYTAYLLSQDSLFETNLDRYVEETFQETFVVQHSYDEKRQQLTVTTLGKRYDAHERELLEQSLDDYDLSHVKLTLIQIPDLNQLDPDQLEKLFNERVK
ncbi:DUF389 domain-containing protein [Exiguobacterium sp. TBG-PICH-001]|uniref:DUF389 domain-containing protein n=1 Tax=Exiguobacterium abrahamii TaxID=2785532 RepID=UPI0018A6DD78|nr:DUF389 domain-containing protein [Exiguobacterium sp. TBG-PICH-001]MBF8153112.1 DUF389 domain-containing protein [Exiguobacterium sp. TBG-PICH-001]